MTDRHSAVAKLETIQAYIQRLIGSNRGLFSDFANCDIEVGFKLRFLMQKRTLNIYAPMIRLLKLAHKPFCFPHYRMHWEGSIFHSWVGG